MSKKIELKKPLTGMEILQAVKQVAGDDFGQVVSRDNPSTWVVGQKSYTMSDVAIGVGRHALPQLCLDETYTHVHVIAWDFTGSAIAGVEYEPAHEGRAIEEFAEALEQLI